jgi:GNAT superfamily N-acetyltransferase
MPNCIVRDATADDIEPIAEVAIVTGQDEEWEGSDPAYVGHLLNRGRVVVAEAAGYVIGFGATMLIGTGDAAVSMLCDLFVQPSAHGRGCGRAMLTALWQGERRRMTFSSQHANALPLYTSFGVDAWWPLLYLRGEPAALRLPHGWQAAAVAPGQAAQQERSWSGADRTDDYLAWAGRPAGYPVAVSQGGDPVAVGVAGGVGHGYGLTHMAISPGASDRLAADAVLAALASLPPSEHGAGICLPAPHPATRQLMASGWRITDYDLFMAGEPDMLNPRRSVPSPGMA